MAKRVKDTKEFTTGVQSTVTDLDDSIIIQSRVLARLTEENNDHELIELYWGSLSALIKARAVLGFPKSE